MTEGLEAINRGDGFAGQLGLQNATWLLYTGVYFILDRKAMFNMYSALPIVPIIVVDNLNQAIYLSTRHKPNPHIKDDRRNVRSTGCGR